jgi:hypothetical protein
MAEISITPEIIEQTELLLKECMRLQELIDVEILDKTFIWYPNELEVNTILDIFRKEKRTREENVAEFDDENKDVEVKPKHNVIFKVD